MPRYKRRKRSKEEWDSFARLEWAHAQWVMEADIPGVTDNCPARDG